MNHTRREILKCLAAGGAIVAGELWIPGQRKVFLPSESKWITLAPGEYTVLELGTPDITDQSNIDLYRKFIRLDAGEVAVQQSFADPLKATLSNVGDLLETGVYRPAVYVNRSGVRFPVDMQQARLEAEKYVDSLRGPWSSSPKAGYKRVDTDQTREGK